MLSRTFAALLLSLGLCFGLAAPCAAQCGGSFDGFLAPDGA